MSPLRRAWEAPFWAHVVLLGIVLTALIPVVGTRSSFSPDEPVAITQARSLANGGGWIVEHPFPEVDPFNRFYPLAGSSLGEDGYAPFAKHPVYPVILAALEPVGGLGAMMALSVLATVAAAAFAGLLARNVTGGLERPVLWAVGVASPLLFDGYLVIAHSLAAALVTGATLAVVAALQRRRVGWILLAALLLAASVMLRSEALIFAGALGVAVMTVAVASRRFALIGQGAFLVLAGWGAALAEKWLLRLAIGAAQVVSIPVAGGGFAETRLAGFINTWLNPSSESTIALGDALLVAVLFMGVAAVCVLRWRSSRPHLLVFLGFLAVLATATAFLIESDRVIPGLLIAFSPCVFGIGLIDRQSLQDPARLLLTVTVGIFVAGVLATQYGAGGSAEWGGRYFALAVPLLSVMALDGLQRRAPALPMQIRQRAGAGLALCSLILAVGAMTALVSVHRQNEELLTRLATNSAQVTPGDGGLPVVVSSWPNISRHAWPTPVAGRWLFNDDDERAADLASRLLEVDIAQLTFIGQEEHEVAPYLRWYEVDPSRSYQDGRWQVSVLIARPTVNP